jgi:hypothetical protein
LPQNGVPNRREIGVVFKLGKYGYMCARLRVSHPQLGANNACIAQRIGQNPIQTLGFCLVSAIFQQRGSRHESGPQEDFQSMLRATLSRYAQRLGGRVPALTAALAIAWSASAYGGSTMHVSGSAAGASPTCIAPTGAGGAVTCGAIAPFSATGTLISALANAARSNDGDDARSASLADIAHPFINCTGNGLTGQRYGSASALDGTIAAGRGAAASAHGKDRHAGPFAFGPTATDATNMTAMDFREGAAFDLDFIERFRDFEDGGSDKVAAMVVPLPPALALGLAGLAGAIVAARRVNRRSAAW